MIKSTWTINFDTVETECGKVENDNYNVKGSNRFNR